MKRKGYNYMIWKYSDAWCRKGSSLTAEKISALSIPAVVIMGDNDIVLPEHAQQLANPLGTKPVIVSGDHSSYLVQTPAALLHELQKFYKSQPEKGVTS